MCHYRPQTQKPQYGVIAGCNSYHMHYTHLHCVIFVFTIAYSKQTFDQLDKLSVYMVHTQHVSYRGWPITLF